VLTKSCKCEPYSGFVFNAVVEGLGRLRAFECVRATEQSSIYLWKY
jgi:hypothetical protein